MRTRVRFKAAPAANKDSFVFYDLHPLGKCDRFIKMALPAFTTSIIKANPIVFPSEILNILQPAVERQTDPSRLSTARATAQRLEPA